MAKPHGLTVETMPATNAKARIGLTLSRKVPESPERPSMKPFNPFAALSGLVRAAPKKEAPKTSIPTMKGVMWGIGFDRN